MEITKFKKTKDNQYKVVLGDTEITLYDDIIIKYNLLVNKKIDNAMLKIITDENNQLTAYYLSIKYINKRLRSEKEIVNFLTKKEYSQSIINDTIKRLKDNNFINNDLYLKSYYLDQINLSNNGPYKIKKDLLNLGFNEDDINNIIDYNDEIWNTKINKIITKKEKSNHKLSNYEFKLKVKRDLINLGYQSELIDNSLNNTLINDEEMFIKRANTIYSKYINKYEYNKFVYVFRNKLLLLGYSNSLIDKYLEQIKNT